MGHADSAWSMPLDGGRVAHVITTDRSHGDLGVQTGSVSRIRLENTRRAIVDAPWSWLHQVHGGEVVLVEAPGERAGEKGDALCTGVSDAPIAVQVADCAPVALMSQSGVIAVAHAGWRGLVAGVIGATVATMADLGATDIVAVLGPCIHPAAYEFGERDLQLVERVLGPRVRSLTRDGAPALDVPAAVRAALDLEGVPLVAQLGACTASNAGRYWSHRASGDRERHAMVCWMQER